MLFRSIVMSFFGLLGKIVKDTHGEVMSEETLTFMADCPNCKRKTKHFQKGIMNNVQYIRCTYCDHTTNIGKGHVSRPF